MKVLTKYILPATLVAGFLFFFIQTVFFDHYPNTDDLVYDWMVGKLGIIETIKLLFKIDTGRWFSHIIVAISFYFLRQNLLLCGMYLSAMMLFFILNLAYVYKNYSLAFLHKKVSAPSQIRFSLISAATLFFLLFEGRLETFGWVSSAINHLLSVILCLFLFGILLKQTRSVTHVCLAIPLSAFIGGSNEVNAICMILCLAGLLFFSLRYFASLQLNRVAIILSIVFIALSLFLNMSSGGYEGRMNGLPSFTYYQSFKNTVHSFLMPFLHYMYLPIFLGALVVFILYFKRRDHYYSKRTLTIFACVAAIAVISFFLNCFLLSDVVPARAALWAYTLALITLGFFLVSDKNEARS